MTMSAAARLGYSRQWFALIQYTELAVLRRRVGAGINGMGETAIRLHVEEVEPGVYVATSPDVPGLVAEGRSLTEAVEIAQGLARKIAESCIANGDPLPPALATAVPGHEIDLLVPIGIS